MNFSSRRYYIAFIEYSEIGDTPLQKLLGHNVEVLKNWDRLLESFYKYSSFDLALQEEVRRAIAYQIGCAQCISHGCPTPVVTDIKTKVAVDFAKKIAQTQFPVTKQDVDQLKEYFSDHEIAELCAFIAFGTSYARFSASLNVDVIKS